MKYADGPRDAECLLVHPKTGRVHIIDKKADGGHLYEGPARLTATGTNVFRPIAVVDLWATDAAFSPDGEQLAVRGYFGGIAYAWNGGRIKKQTRLDVPLQRQGESVTYTLDGSRLLYGSEDADSPVQPEDVPGHEAKSPSRKGSAQTGAGAGGGSPLNADYKVGALVLAAGLALGSLQLPRRAGPRRSVPGWRAPPRRHADRGGTHLRPARPR